MAEFRIETHNGPVKHELPFENDEVKVKTIKKYPVGCDADKELIFSFPFLLNKETVSYIENHAHVMFIIRGPPSTGKATLSEMLTERYPNAVYCCADRYFANSFTNAKRDRESIKASHEYCQKKTETACGNNVSLIIVQNTHMRKWEMQVYLNMAAKFNYTVIMAITLYRFDCTPKALAENNTDGLDIRYFQNRLKQWEDVLPLLTGWFLSPNDSQHILHHTFLYLESLLSDGKFCRVFEVYDIDDIRKYFNPRLQLCCPAAYTKNRYLMKKYYLSDEVQVHYGMCFTIFISGYLVTKSSVFGIVDINKEMKPLIMDEKFDGKKRSQYLDDVMSSLDLQSNLHEHFKTTIFPEEENLPQKCTIILEDIDENEVKLDCCDFIHIAQKGIELNVEEIGNNFKKSLESVVDGDGYLCDIGCVESESKICRLPNDMWFIKPPQKIGVKTIFTGLYV